MSRGFDLASGAAAWMHRSGERIGDLVGDSVYGPYNNVLGEFNFFALALQVSKILDKIGENRANNTNFQMDMGARALGLTLCDYATIADEKGHVRVKGRRARFTDKQVAAYVGQAHLLYQAGEAAVDYGGDSISQQRWRVRADSFGREMSVESNDWIPSLNVVPYLGALAFSAMEFIGQEEPQDTPFKRAFINFEEGMSLLGEVGMLSHPGVASDKIGRRLRFVSNDLVALDPVVAKSGKPFEMLDVNNPRCTGRAALQIFAASYLQAVSRWEPVAASMLTDVAYCGWGMTKMGASDYADERLETELLGEQWNLGLRAHPYWLREDEKYYIDVRNELSAASAKQLIIDRN